jgi:hypothetical protein
MSNGNDDRDHRLTKPCSLLLKTSFWKEFQTFPMENTPFPGCNFWAKKQKKTVTSTREPQSLKFHDPVGKKHQKVLQFGLFPDLNPFFRDLNKSFVFEISQCPV